MIKRIIPLVLAVALITSLVAIPALAVDPGEYTVLNFEDYISGTEVDANDKAWTFLHFPNELCAAQINGKYGTTYLEPGKFSGVVTCDGGVGSTCSAGGYWPGGIMTKTFMDASQIPNGSRFGIRVDFWVSDIGYQACIDVNARVGVLYYDSDFNLVGYSKSQPTSWIIDQSSQRAYVYMETEVEKPANTAYFLFQSTLDLTVDRSNDHEVVIEWQFFKPTLKISTSVWEAIIKGKDPEGSPSIGGLGDAEDDLFGDTSSGRDEFSDIVGGAYVPILDNASGFLFLSMVIDRFAGISWLKGLFFISLSLGVFGFLCNIALSLGRSAERRFSRAGGKG